MAQNTMIKLIENTDIQEMQGNFKAIEKAQEVIKRSLKKGHDYGEIPGTNKPTLLKPGAEKILMLYGLKSEYEIVTQIEDWDKGIFAYTVKCTLSHGDEKITEGLGSCNNQEDKYKYRWVFASEVPDEIDKSTLKANKSGKFRILNEEPWSQVNTILKMAKKRAQIDATLTVSSLSEIFTQDLEDLSDFNQREQLDNMNNKDAEGILITFGKYKGRTLGDIFTQDTRYVRWLADNAREEIVKEASKMLLENGINANVESPKEQAHEKANEEPSFEDEDNGFYPLTEDDIPF